MAFFRNRAVNLLNLHYGVHSVALGGGAAFFAVYLVTAGVPVPAVLVSLALILLGRFVIRPIIIGLSVRFGLRAMVVLGTVLSALQYPLVAEVHGLGVALVGLCIVSAVGETIYWSSYHAYFAALGDDAHRGHQIGLREAVAAVVGIASPIATGWLLVTFGPRIAFGATAVVVLLSSLALLWAPDVGTPRHVAASFRGALPAALVFAADGWIGVGTVLVWPIALFLALDASLMSFGGALAIAALAGAAGALALGRHIDRGHGERAVWLACGALAAVIALRGVATGNATAAVLANALGALAACLHVPTVMTAVYTQARRSPCTLRFHVITEGGWDLGGAAGLLTTALLTALGAPLQAGILLSLAGIMPLAVMLRRYYADDAAAAAPVAELQPAATPGGQDP
jgi:MFS transporter, DHA1 family, inner membrane transport protein